MNYFNSVSALNVDNNFVTGSGDEEDLDTSKLPKKYNTSWYDKCSKTKTSPLRYNDKTKTDCKKYLDKYKGDHDKYHENKRNAEKKQVLDPADCNPGSGPKDPNCEQAKQDEAKDIQKAAEVKETNRKIYSCLEEKSKDNPDLKKALNKIKSDVNKQMPSADESNKQNAIANAAKQDSTLSSVANDCDQSVKTGIVEEPKDGKTSCAIDNVGWVICPASTFLAKVISGIYKYIANHFLTIKSGELFGIDKSTFESWGVFRDMANVILVIFFTIVIISQITNVGISNYGIKKMLPRLFIFAILINVSYFASVIFVDLSNILGRSIYNILSSGAPPSGLEPLEGSVVSILGTTGAAVAAGGFILSFVAALLAILLMFIILIVRQAVVIMLVVISPVAFASAILPNTESFFNKWKSMFKGVLIVFPTASLVMGGMTAASNILVPTADNKILEVLYTTIPLIGLFSVYIVIKGVLAIIDKITGGSVSGKIGGMLNGIQNKAKNSSLAQHERNMWGGARRKIGEIPGISNVRGAMRKSRLSALANQKALEGAKADDDRNGMINYLKNLPNPSNDQRRQLQRLEAAKAKEEAELISGAAMGAAKGFGYTKNADGKIVYDAGKVEGHAKGYLSEALKSGDVDRIDQAIKAVNSANLSDENKAQVISDSLKGHGAIQGGSQAAEAIHRNAEIFGKFKNSDAALGKLMGNLASGQEANLEAIEKDVNTYKDMTAKQLAQQGKNSRGNIDTLRSQDASFNAEMQNLARIATADTELMSEAKKPDYIYSLAGLPPGGNIQQSTARRYPPSSSGRGYRPPRRP